MFVFCLPADPTTRVVAVGWPLTDHNLVIVQVTESQILAIQYMLKYSNWTKYLPNKWNVAVAMFFLHISVWIYKALTFNYRTMQSLIGFKYTPSIRSIGLQIKCKSQTKTWLIEPSKCYLMENCCNQSVIVKCPVRTSLNLKRCPGNLNVQGVSSTACKSFIWLLRHICLLFQHL